MDTKKIKSTGASDILDLVEYMAKMESPESLSTMAKNQAMAKSSCLRLLHILIDKRYVERSGAGRYRLLSPVGIGGMTQKQLRLVRLAEPLLKTAANQSGISAFLAVMTAAGKIRFLSKQLPTDKEVIYDRDISHLREPHLNSAGLCILAFMDPPNADAIRQVPPAQITKIRKNGIAITTRGIIDGASGVSAPVFDQQNKIVGAFNLAGPTYNFDKSTQLIKKIAKQGATQLSLLMQ